MSRAVRYASLPCIGKPSRWDERRPSRRAMRSSRSLDGIGSFTEVPDHDSEPSGSDSDEESLSDDSDDSDANHRRHRRGRRGRDDSSRIKDSTLRDVLCCTAVLVFGLVAALGFVLSLQVVEQSPPPFPPPPPWPPLPLPCPASSPPLQLQRMRAMPLPVHGYPPLSMSPNTSPPPVGLPPPHRSPLWPLPQQSPPRPPPRILHSGAQCAPSQTCIGLSCSWASLAPTPDGSKWSTDAATLRVSTCAECGCRSPLWPVRTCIVTLIPTRPGLADHDDLGWGSRVNTLLTTAPFALANGYGFQWPSHICAMADRQHPHCFFQPLSHCGQRAEQVCPDEKTFGACTSWLNRPYRADHVTKAYHQPTDKEITTGCISAATLLQMSGDGCASLANGRLLAWRVIARLFLRPQPEISERTASLVPEAFHSWMIHPFGAIHVRRGDKVFGNNAEAKAVNPCSYLDRLDSLMAGGSAGHIFVATDDLSILPELRICETTVSRSWVLHHFDGSPSRGISGDVTYRLWAEVRLMVRAAWCVGTYSSNIGRLVQMLRVQPPETMASMDRAQWFMRP